MGAERHNVGVEWKNSSKVFRAGRCQDAAMKSVSKILGAAGELFTLLFDPSSKQV